MVVMVVVDNSAVGEAGGGAWQYDECAGSGRGADGVGGGGDGVWW